MNTYLSTLSEHEVQIPCPGAVLHGDVAIPAGAKGLVIFAHGSGISGTPAGLEGALAGQRRHPPFRGTGRPGTGGRIRRRMV